MEARQRDTIASTMVQEVIQSFMTTRSATLDTLLPTLFDNIYLQVEIAMSKIKNIMLKLDIVNEAVLIS